MSVNHVAMPMAEAEPVWVFFPQEGLFALPLKRDFRIDRSVNEYPVLIDVQ